RPRLGVRTQGWIAARPEHECVEPGRSARGIPQSPQCPSGKERSMTRIALALAAILSLVLAPLARAQDDYPSRTVRIIVPFAPGGSTDVVARILADKLATELKQSFVVENRGGAGGNIGADVVAKANPDGYTLLMGTTGVLAINKYLYKEMPFDPERDLAPVSYTSLITNILVVNPQV